MPDFQPPIYSRPRSLAEALAALQRPGARIYAGGTDFLVALHQREPWATSVHELVDIKALPEAAGIVDMGDAVRVGALVTPKQLLDHHSAPGFAGALLEAAAKTSAPTLRARGTVGGNLVTPHSSGDMATALLALDAVAEVVSDTGEVRRVSVESLVAGPNKKTEPRALVLAVRIAKVGSSAFEKHGLRSAFSRSLGAVAVLLRGGRHRVALGGVGQRPCLAPHVAAALDQEEDLTSAITLDVPEIRDPRVTPALLRSLIFRARDRAVTHQ